MSQHFAIISSILFSVSNLLAQHIFTAEGNGVFMSPASTNLDIISSLDNSNSLLRMGDNNSIKSSFGFNGNTDLFVLSMAGTLGSNDLTITPNGKLGVNGPPDTSRMLITHNSTSGVIGSAHLLLSQNSMADPARFIFENVGSSKQWLIKATAKSGSAKFKLAFTDGIDSDILTFDGDQFYTGIHQTNPEGYLHIKQEFPSIDAIAMVNDNTPDKWSMRIGDEDILFYFNDGIRGGFDVSTGNYNNFPPPPPLTSGTPLAEDHQILEKVNQIKALVIGDPSFDRNTLILDPNDLLNIDPSLVSYAEESPILGVNYSRISLLVIRAIQSRQDQISEQNNRISRLAIRHQQNLHRLRALEEKVATLH
ncbi:MAG: hypothetical protein KDC53_06295 [Saprospiraceae bacterium]|nr:hypothetical protein [Saprospiraceae bacterium]